MTRGAFFLVLALVVFAGIGAMTTGPQPKPSIQSELTETQYRLDELLTILEAEIDRQQESHNDNLRRLASRARDRFETIDGKNECETSSVRRFDE